MPDVTPLRSLLLRLRGPAKTNREAGTAFEDLTVAYLRHEPRYRELYASVETWAEWAGRQGLDKRDTGIDLVATTTGGHVHAVQCKLYAENHRVQKADIDSFFTASGKAPFAHRLIVSTTDDWSENAEQALEDQQIPVIRIDLTALEESVIDWSRFVPERAPELRLKKTLRLHQTEAVDKVTAGLAVHERGKLVMACGTGKTFTSLKLAEQIAGAGKRVLFLVPSLSLLSQSLTEWTQESVVPLRSFAVCSDGDVGKKRRSEDDEVRALIHELAYPATTNAARLANEVGTDDAHMTVVFATYHSIAVVHEAQHLHGLPDFDLVLCDEAHRTTGHTLADEDESAFVRVHNAAYIRGARRLYMTATPRVFGDVAKAQAEKDDVTLASMDDPAMFGPTLHTLSFSEAVKRDLLVDYKVIVLALEERQVSRRLQDLLKDPDNQLRVDDAAKIVGCWKALSKQGLAESLTGDARPMKRAVAFCQVIRGNPKAKAHKVASITIQEMFGPVVNAYHATAEDEEESAGLTCEVAHVDGGMNASQKEAKLAWLKAEPPEDTCRILSNVRCLSEGVDVPALDAVLFLTPRNSQVDVVQSVGRVMRKAPGKTRGYVVLPVVIPAGVEPHEALSDNQTYKVVWQVLQALRSHDDRFDAMINKLELTGADPNRMEVIAVTEKLTRRVKASKEQLAARAARGGRSIGAAANLDDEPTQLGFGFEPGEIERAIYAKVVAKVGNRHHWEDWANDIAKIARTHIDRIEGILENPANVREREAFEKFAAELRDDLNDQIGRGEIVELLAQHEVTRPVFQALCADDRFVRNNAMSRALSGVLEALSEHHIDKEAATLRAFYDSVRLRAEGIDSAEGRQKIVVELYDKFFRNAFPKMSERLGIVYTPVEIVDFILKSVDDLLREEFGQTLGSEGVHILDPFTGTGTFITRLLQSGLIRPEELPRKYAKELHANELVLLAYYIAAINIEGAYHGVVGGEYRPFEGICLTDTFQLYEKDDLVSQMLADNSARRTRQKQLDIRVIVGNPPYSVGQKNENDNNANVSYPKLDSRIAATYASKSDATNKNALYDSYIRAIRWASDRVGNSGIVAFITNAGFVEANTASGLRKCLVDDFSSLYVFHLRGNQRTSGEVSKREGGKVFGSGSRAPVAVSVLVRNPSAARPGRVYFRDVGDFLTREEKLQTVSMHGSVGGISKANGWTLINPDAHGDWLKQRDSTFESHAVMGSRDAHDASVRIFNGFSRGVVTGRDVWAQNPSRSQLGENMARMIAFFGDELARFESTHPALDRKQREGFVDRFINTDPTKISWTDTLKRQLVRAGTLQFEPSRAVPSLYRPFTKGWLYFEGRLVDRLYQMPRLFPHVGVENRVINVSALGGASFSALMSDVVANKFVGETVTQWFPLYLYDTSTPNPEDEEETRTPDVAGPLFVTESAPPAYNATGTATPARRDGITDAALAYFQTAYLGEDITKADVFYYVYGLLHSEDYRSRYADNLGKELPRIPRVNSASDFRAFVAAGRALGDLHVGYERAPEYAAIVTGPPNPTSEHYRVEKMRFGKGKDKSVVHYNAHFTVRDIPLAAYDYVVNGKPAIEWVMERQAVTVDKASGIVKDANAWATETVGDPRYPLSLLLRVITVSLKTMEIVRALPTLDLE
jgi:predicted helicase